MLDELVMLSPAVPGAMVRDPYTKEPLPAEGAPKPLTTFWLRRLRDGDVVRVVPKPALKKGER